jgi:hypothetical protein
MNARNLQVAFNPDLDDFADTGVFQTIDLKDHDD